MDHRAVVDAHVTAFNEGVRTGDFAPMMAGFHHDARLEFRGVAAGPFEGRVSIAEAYRTQPPDDEIDVFEVADRSGTTVVSYGWRKFVRVAQGGGPARR
jgi:hypothetical protein